MRPTRAAAVLAVTLLPLSLFGAGCGSGSSSDDGRVIARDTLRADLTAARDKASMPALAGAVVSSRAVQADALGVRKLGAAGAATARDRFHVGSVTKPMTATLIALYVEEGKLAWTTKVADVFPEFSAGMRPEYRDATLEDLLEHRSGLPGFATLAEIAVVPPFPGDAAAQRRAFTGWVLSQAPEAAPGEFHYSNGGYAVAAAMLEKVTGESWESLMRRRLFGPLGMTTAGFGWPSLVDPDEPNGHVTADDGAVTPHDDTDPVERVPAIFAPAGDVHASIGDFARFAQMHLRGLRGERTLLRPETVRKLHTPRGSYALGWEVENVDGVPTSFHDGSADTFYAVAAIQPSRDRAVVLATNVASEPAVTEVQALTKALGAAGRSVSE
jgi:CubicO group peptidase (beta-lactamase class C family)